MTDEFGGRDGSYLHQHDAPMKEVDTMAASIPIEEESGRCTTRLHRHNGYYAGDFSQRRQGLRSAPARPTPRPSAA